MWKSIHLILLNARLSTIRSADKIVALKDGIVQEIGTHEELMKLRGLYFSLVTAQTTNEDDDEELVEEREAEDTVEDLEVVNQSINTGAKVRVLDRKVSTLSATSQDDFDMDNSDTINGYARMASQGSELRRGYSAQESTAPTEEDLPKPSQKRILKANAPEWHIILFGLIASGVNGATFPVFSIIFGEVLGVLSDPVDSARDDSVKYALLFVGIGVVAGLAFFFQVRNDLRRWMPIFLTDVPVHLRGGNFDDAHEEAGF